jgi:hypothetical protein
MAGEGDAERLVVLLEARVDQFEKRMKKASGTATRSYRTMRTRSNSATRQMERDMVRSTGRINQALAATSTKIGVFGKALIGGLVAGGVAGTVSQIGQIARGIAEIGDEAKRAGLDIKAFQELKFVAEQNRIGIDGLVDGIKELNLRADEFITTGGGSAAEAFSRLGFDAETLASKLEDPSALFTEIIGKIGELDQAAQIRVADEIFGGTGGEKFVQLIAQGEQGIRDTIQAAYDLGAVLDEETIAKADELDRAFSEVSTTVGNTLKQAIVNASYALYDFLQQFKAVEDRTTASLDRKLTELDAKRRMLQDAILEQQSMVDDMTVGPNDISRVALEGNIESLRKQMEALVDEEQLILDALESRTPIQPPTITTPPIVSGSGGTGGTSSIREQRDAVSELVRELETELMLLGKTELEQRVNAELRKAGADATDDQRSAIVDLVTQIETERVAMDQLEAAMDSAKDLTKEFLSGLIGDLKNGVDGTEALSNAFGRLGDRLLDMALDQAINALLSSLLGAIGGGGSSNLLQTGLSVLGMPSYANGTNFHPGGLAMVGEQGPEIVSLPRGSQVTPNGQIPAANRNTPSSANANTRTEIVVSLGPELRAEFAQIAEGSALRVQQQYRRSGLAGDVRRINQNPNRR